MRSPCGFSAVAALHMVSFFMCCMRCARSSSPPFLHPHFILPFLPVPLVHAPFSTPPPPLPCGRPVASDDAVLHRRTASAPHRTAWRHQIKSISFWSDGMRDFRPGGAYGYGVIVRDWGGSGGAGGVWGVGVVRSLVLWASPFVVVGASALVFRYDDMALRRCDVIAVAGACIYGVHIGRWPPWGRRLIALSSSPTSVFLWCDALPRYRYRA
ncbi:hypothetical protein C8R46DRAFT_1076222 [Mycena filopes]|nr:hypothetical protein C8R46DRAFT_1076222 [Mycena filopes]